MPADEAAKRLSEWLDNDEDDFVFTRRQISDIGELLRERKEDVPYVWRMVGSLETTHDLPLGAEKALNALYTRFYTRILEMPKDD